MADQDIEFLIVIVHWAGKDSPACPRHLEKLLGLGAVLGIQITWSLPLSDNLKCSNCESEAKRDRKIEEAKRG